MKRSLRSAVPLGQTDKPPCGSILLLTYLIRSPANRMFLDLGHVGQAFGTLKGLSDGRLQELLQTHGFPNESIHRLRQNDRAGLIEGRLKTLIAGERNFMTEQSVVLPVAQTAATIADSDVSDEEYSETEPGEADDE
jgi:hypothetical protein